MSGKFKLVARLGSAGERYPHLLVDAHGWVLRLGPHYRLDEKYYSSLPAALEGMAAHLLRRRLGQEPASGLEALARKVREELTGLREMATRYLENLGNVQQPRPVDAVPALGWARGSSREDSGPVTVHPAPKRTVGGPSGKTSANQGSGEPVARPTSPEMPRL